MGKSTWRRVGFKDSRRIECTEIMDGHISCGKRAYACNTVYWETAGNQGVSFFYYCETHTRERRDKEERETVKPLAVSFD